MEEESKKSEKNDSLPVKGASAKKTVRAVLDTPYTPRIVLNDFGVVEKCLLSLSTCYEERQENWNVLMKMTKEERRDFRRKENPQFMDLRNDVVVGFNVILRGLERGLIASLILSDKVSWNSMLGKVIVEIAERSCIPVVKLPTLHDLSKKLFGIGCHALGVKKTAAGNENSKLRSLHEAIVEADKEFKVPFVQKAGNMERKKPQPYCRDFYSKGRRNSRVINFESSIDIEEPRQGKSNVGMKTLIDSLTEEQSVHETQNLSECHKGNIVFKDYKPLRVKEVESVKNPPKSKKAKLMKKKKLA